MEKRKAILREWRLDLDLISNTYFLHGFIYDDKLMRYLNGTKIRTSKLLKIDFETMTAETKNTIYELKDMGYNF